MSTIYQIILTLLLLASFFLLLAGYNYASIWIMLLIIGLTLQEISDRLKQKK